MPGTTWAHAPVGPAWHHPQCRPGSRHCMSWNATPVVPALAHLQRHLLRQQLPLGRPFGQMGRSLVPETRVQTPWAPCACPRKEPLPQVCFPLLLCEPHPHLDGLLMEPPTIAWHPVHHNSTPTTNTSVNSSLLKCCSLCPCGRKSLFQVSLQSTSQ